jgi:hypothetical protein
MWSPASHPQWRSAVLGFYVVMVLLPLAIIFAAVLLARRSRDAE